MATRDLSREIRHRWGLTLLFGVIGMTLGVWQGAKFATRDDAPRVAQAFKSYYLPARALIVSGLAEIQWKTRIERGLPATSPSLDWYWRMQYSSSAGSESATAVMAAFTSRYRTVVQFVWLMGFGSALFPHLFYFILRRARSRPSSVDYEHRRGATVADAESVSKQLKGKFSTDLQIGGVSIAVGAEPYHFLFAGSTGSGKSVAIMCMADRLRARGDRAIFADSAGAFTARYFDPGRGDLILSPLDARGIDWSPLAEMRNTWDADTISRSIIPGGPESSDASQWNKYAQVLLAEILRVVWAADSDNANILALASMVNAGRLFDALQATPAAALCAPGNEKMLGSVRGILGTYLSPLRYLRPTAGRRAMSLRGWMSGSDNAEAWAFFNYREDQIELVRPLIAAMLDIVAVATLSLPENPSARLWLILDELPSLGKIGSLESFLTKARKHGGCAILGIQAVAQLRATYGKDVAETLLSCASSALILRATDAETAEYMSSYLGEREISRRVESENRSDTGRGSSWAEQISKERVVLASEIQGLPNLHGFFRHTGWPVTAHSRLVPKSSRARAEAFIPRDHWPQEPNLQAAAEPRQQQPQGRSSEKLGPTADTHAIDFSDVLALFDAKQGEET